MSNTTERAKRPSLIAGIFAFGLLWALITVPFIFSPIAQQMGSWHPPYLGICAVLGLACTIGLSMMKKWAAYTYTGFAVLNQIVLFAMGFWDVMGLLVQVVIVFFALKHVSKMS
jgi:hypothetical protein